MNLTEEQQKVVDEAKAFLDPKNKERFFLISAPAGTGKTYLATYLYTDVYCPSAELGTAYEDFYFTATTNKAASVLNANIASIGKTASTIHNLLGLKVLNDTSTGKTGLVASRHKKQGVSNSIIVIDECSMVNRELFDYIWWNTHNCKVIFIGDDRQLPPVKEGISPVFEMRIPIHSLTKIIRSDAHDEITDVCNQLRDNVVTRDFKDIVCKGNITHLSRVEAKNVIDDTFIVSDSSSKILTYTNARCVAYNEYIANLRGQKNFIEEGRCYVVNNNILSVLDKRTNPTTSFYGSHYGGCSTYPSGLLTGGEEIKIDRINDIKVDSILNLSYYDCDFSRLITYKKRWFYEPDTSHVLKIPVSYEEVKRKLKELAKAKNWEQYFRLQETFADVRFRDASTVHKAQGSTLDNVFIDLDDLGTCKQTTVFARLLYVALSRAKERIYLIGNLPERYGKVITQC